MNGQPSWTMSCGRFHEPTVAFSLRNSAGVSLAARERAEPVLDAGVVPRHAREPVRADAVDVAEVVPVRPLDRRDRGRVVERLPRPGRAEVRVERERGQPAPAPDALRAAGSAAAVRVRHGRAGVHPLEPRPVRPRGPLRVGAVGDVHEVLEQLAVADVDRLRDHVGVRVLRDRRVDDPARVVLGVDVLLDRAAGAADADGVERDAVGLDEPLLRHDRRLAAEHEVVVRRRARAARVDDGVALGQGRVVEVAAAADRPLLVPDRDAAVERVEEAAVPERQVGRGRGVRRAGRGSRSCR